MRIPGQDRSGASGLRNPQDFAAGMFFAVIGAIGLWIAQDYPVGSPTRLGTGVFPRILCWGMILIGGVILLQAFVTAGPRLTGWAVRPLLCVILAIVAFGLLLEPAGLVLATVALLLIAAAGTPETRWREVAAFTVFMAALGVGIFAWGLGMSLRVWPI